MEENQQTGPEKSSPNNNQGTEPSGKDTENHTAVNSPSETDDTGAGGNPQDKPNEQPATVVKDGISDSTIGNNLNYIKSANNVHLSSSEKNRFMLKSQPVISAVMEAEYSEQLLFFFKKKEATHIRRTVENNRILIVAGNERVEKALPTLALAATMKQESEKAQKIILIHNPAKQLIIDIRNDIIRKHQSHDTIIVFQITLSKANVEIVRFMNDLLNHIAVFDQLRNELSQNRCKLLFVVDRAEHEYLPNEHTSTLVIKAGQPEPDRLKMYIDYSIQKAAKDRFLKEQQATRLLDQKELLSSHFIRAGLTVNQINLVLEQLQQRMRLDKHLAPDERLLKEITEDSLNLSHWLRSVATIDRPVWNRLLTLCLTQGASLNQRISLLQYNLLLDKIEEYFMEIESVQIEHQLWPRVKSDTEWLEACRAVKDSSFNSSGSIGITFKEDYYVDELWNIFINEYSLQLTRLLPLISTLMKDKVLGTIAARIYGRLCEVDMGQVRPQILSLAASKHESDNYLVSAIYQGIWASKNLKYRAFAVEILKGLIQKSNDRHNFDKVWTYIIVTSKLAIIEPEVSFKNLGALLNEVIVKPIDTYEKLQSKIDWRTKQLFTGIRVKELYDLLESEEKVKDFERYLKETLTLMNLVTNLLLEVCYESSILLVFEEIEKWLKEDNSTLHRLLANIVFGEAGLLKKLSLSIKQYDETLNRNEEWIMIVSVMIMNEAHARKIAGFINNTFPNRLLISSDQVRELLAQAIKSFELWLQSIEGETEKLNSLSTFFAYIIASGSYLGLELEEIVSNCMKTSKYKAWRPIAAKTLLKSDQERKIMLAAKN